MRLALFGGLACAVAGAALFGTACRRAEAPPPTSIAPAATGPALALPVRNDEADLDAEAWLFPREEGLGALAVAVRSREGDAGLGAFTLSSSPAPSNLLVCALRLAGAHVGLEEEGAAAPSGDAGEAEDSGAAAEPVDAARVVRAAAVCASDALVELERVKLTIEAKRYDAALELLDARTWSSLVGEEKSRLRARALDGLERRAEALELWRELAKSKGSRVQEACVRAARDLVILGGKEAGVEARGFVLRAYAEAPAWAEGQEGLERLLAEASKLAGEKPERDLVTRAREAQGWREAGDEARAKRIANEVLKRGALASGEPACRARTVLAQEASKGQKAAAWGQAIDACAGQELRAPALFSGAKASFSEKRPDEARARYALLVEAFPQHRLADDASLALGKIQLEAGDAAGAEATFAAVAGKHPGGDMVAEATFKAALLRVQRGAYAEAKALVEDVSGDDTDLHWSSGGRARHLRAWCNERLGDREAAKRDYAEVVRLHPYAFWMLASSMRLRALESAALQEALRAMENEPVEPFRPIDDDALLLAREAFFAGRNDILRDLAAHALFGGRSREAGWAFAWVLDAAGLETLGHGRPRALAPQYLAHAPHGVARLGWMASYPTPHAERVRTEATKRGVPASLVWAIMREESAFKVEVKSSAKAYGLMQLIVPTAKLMANGEGVTPSERTLVDPAVNVALGTKLLGVLRKSYAANPILAIPAYNAGGGAVNRWLEQRKGMPFELWVESIPYDETRGYLKRVTTSWIAYARLYAPDELAQLLQNPWPDAVPMSSAAGAP